ncbi:MAG: hypothetical protein Q9168_005671 [Polycauliona sp. 1 TL-2023]
MIPPLLATIALTALLNSVFAILAHMGLSPRSPLGHTADGINDKGSSQYTLKGNTNVMSDIERAVDAIPVGIVYKTGQQIACYRIHAQCGFPHCPGICAPICENTAAQTVQKSTKDNDDEWRNALSGDVKTDFGDVIGDLRYIGAKVCGTAPVIRGRDRNKNEDGCITVNYVANHCNPDNQLRCLGA